MKKLIATLLAAIMLLACIPALAEADASDTTVTYESMGLVMDNTALFSKCENHVLMQSQPVERHDPYVAMAQVLYFAVPLEDIKELQASAENDEEKNVINRFIRTLSSDIGYIFVSDAADKDAMFQSVGIELTDEYSVEEIVTDGEWHYYYITCPTERFLEIYDNPEEYGIDFTEEEAKAEREKAIAEIDLVNSGLVDLVKTCKHITPVDPTGVLIGKALHFETTDLNGNALKSDDLFKDNKITLVNMWGTWCPACTGELGELAVIHTRLQEKGCGVVGIEVEDEGVTIEDIKEEAEGILNENGVNYPNAWCPTGEPVFDDVHSFPTSFFVDSEGKILTYPISGAAVNQYEAVIDKLLAGENVDVITDTGAQANDQGKYNIYVFDTDNQPVEGVIIQFCDDQTCSIQTTNADGVASFEVSEAKVYDVHVLKAPDAYRQDEQSYKTLDTYSDVTIFLDKAE